MGFLNSVGVEGNLGGSINWGGLGSWAVLIFLAIVFIILAGVGTFFYYSKKIKKGQFKYYIPIFQDLHGKLSRVAVDRAKEVFVPDSNVSLFYLQKYKIYIARPTRAMGKNEFWYKILGNGEWVNFDMSTDPEKDTLSKANYDHRDTRYAYINLKDIIKRNYKDKAIKWWKEYSHLITFVIVSFIFVGAMWILLAKVGNLIEMLGPFTEQMSYTADKMSGAVQNAQNINSGVVPG